MVICSMITPRVVGVRNKLCTACIVDGNDVTLQVLFVIIICVIILKANNPAVTVIVDEGLSSVGFFQNAVAVKGIGNTILLGSDAVCTVFEGVRTVLFQSSNMRPSERIATVGRRIAQYSVYSVYHTFQCLSRQCQTDTS